MQNPLTWGATLLVFVLFWALSMPGGNGGLHYHLGLSTALDDALAADDWRYQPHTRSLGYRDDPIWLRWEVPDDDSELVVLHNAWVDNFTLYFVRDGQTLRSYRGGGSHPVSTRAIDNTEFAFPVPAEPRPTHVYLLDHNATSPVLYPLTFSTWPELLSHSTLLHATHGVFYGIALIMIFYNLVIFSTVGDRAYLYLVLYAGSLMTLLSTSDGFGQFYFWRDSDWLQVVLVSVSLACVVVFIGQFCRHFLDADQHAPRLTKCLKVLQALMVANTVVIVLSDNELSATLEPVIVVLFAIVLVSISVTRALQGSSAAQIFLAANGIICLFGSVVALTHLGWLPDSPMSRQAALVGAALELALLSFALAQRLKQQKRLQEILSSEASDLSRQVEELRAATDLAEEHRQLQRSMQHQQKLKTIGQLAGGIAHDFNNILATILGFTELALERPENGNRLKRYLEEIRDAGERGAALVRQLITYSRGDSQATSERVTLNDVLAEAATLLRGSLPTTVSVTTSAPEESLKALLDPTQLKQVLVNLSLNASEAMGNRGAIELSLRQAAMQQLECSSCLNRFSGDFAVITVHDEGAGFEGRSYDLFTPFYTTKPVGRGSGLGLSVVHGIVHEHGGHVHVSGGPGEGTRFEVYLPMADAPAAGARPRGEHILLIEDDESLARYLEALLGREGYQVTHAALPTTALETFMATPDAFDLVITDQVMPHGTGVELAQDLLALRPDLPVILTTANPDAISEASIRQSGIQAVFGKPIQSELLLSKVRGLLKTA